ncbi:pyruvate kinase, partial [Klebsiella pneumoniae]|uniref:pyruvate kinase n=1 Tax=Klebsiella pneumoniae TaxID=573 RepID=UPI0021F6E323
MRRTKIVATLGPGSGSPEIIEEMIRAGVDVFRLNFSHGTHEEQGHRAALI